MLTNTMSPNTMLLPSTSQYSPALLAQSVEHETLNLRVVGSSPTLGEVLDVEELKISSDYKSSGLRQYINTTKIGFKPTLAMHSGLPVHHLNR